MTHDATEHTAARTAQGRSTSIVAVLSLLGVVLAASGAFLHALVTFAPFPGWDLDPMVFAVPHTSLGPARSMLADLVIQIGCVLVLAAEWKAGRRIDWRVMSLLLIGAAVMWIGARRDDPDGVIGSTWIASMVLGATMMQACRSVRLRRTVLALFLALVAMLAVRGAQQVFIEHPETMRSFRANQQRVYDSQGWSADSAMAKAYKRRVEQSDATGWFGLSNVYATFAAGGAAAGGVMLAMTLRRRKSDIADLPTPADPNARNGRGIAPLGTALLLAAGLAALAFSQAKGGFAALAIGIAFAAGVWGSNTLAAKVGRSSPNRTRNWIGRILALGAIASVFILIIANGALLGERGELSLLFRWFYMQAAARVGIMDFLGCGPGGFQSIYSLVKNPLSTEDVSSSHNLLMDYWASGGVLALSWIALWLWWIARAGSTACSPIVSRHAHDAPREPGFRWEHIEPSWCVRVVMGVVVIASLIALKIEQPILTLDLAVVRLAGIGLSGAIAWFVLIRLPDALGEARTESLCRLALSTAAVVMGAHALIDQTGVWPGSASLLMLILGAAAAKNYEPAAAAVAAPAASPRQKLARPVGLLLIAMLVPLLIVSSRSSPRERHLVSAAKAVEPVASLSRAFNEAMSSGGVGSVAHAAKLKEIADELSNEVGGIVQPTPEAIEQGLTMLERRRLETATDRLLTAARDGSKQGEPARDFKSIREASRLQLLLAQRAMDRRDAADAARRFGLAIKWSSERLGDVAPATRIHANEYGWLALVYQGRNDAMIRMARGDEADLKTAAAALEKGSELDPYSLEYPRRLMKVHEKLGNPAEAARWAKRALELDGYKRLDRETQGLSEEDRREATRLSGMS